MDSPTVLSSPAAEACLNTTELLESILVWLDTRSLFLSRRVSHKFHAIISESPALQQRLFLAPVTPEDLLEPDFVPNQTERPYILVDPLSDAEIEEVGRDDQRDMPDSQYTQPAILNPLLFDLPRWSGEKHWPAQMYFRYRFGVQRDGTVPSSALLRKMYLCHPMPALVRVAIPKGIDVILMGWSIRGREGTRSRTLGELMDEIERGADFKKLGLGWRGMNCQLVGRRCEEAPRSWRGRKERMRAKKERRQERRAVVGMEVEEGVSFEEVQGGIQDLFLQVGEDGLDVAQ